MGFRFRTSPVPEHRRQLGAEHEQPARQTQEQEQTDHGADRPVQQRRPRDVVGEQQPSRELEQPHPIVMTAAPGRWDLQPIVPGVSTAYARRNRPNSIAVVAANPSTRNGISRSVETLTAETIPVTTGSAPTSTTSPSVIAIARNHPHPPSGATRKMTASARLARRDRADAVHRRGEAHDAERRARAGEVGELLLRPRWQLERQHVLGEPEQRQADERQREGGQEQLVASAAACVLTSSARIRLRIAGTSDANRDCARVAILGSMARGTS